MIVEDDQGEIVQIRRGAGGTWSLLQPEIAAAGPALAEGAATQAGTLTILAELGNIGRLLAFVIVCGAVLIMRRSDPNAERPFRAPWVPFTPIAGIALCLLLMFSLPAENWVRLAVWLLIGFLIYFGYGRHHSVMKAAAGR